VNWLSNGQVLAEDKARGGENGAAYISWLEATPTTIMNRTVATDHFPQQ